VPGCPESLSDIENNKVSLAREAYPADESFNQLFPTLLSKEMPYLQLKSDPQNGELLRSEQPLRVTTPNMLTNYVSLGCCCA
jgi:hypothetical protein